MIFSPILQEIFQSFHCIIFCINFTFQIHSETSYDVPSTMEHTLYSTDLGEWLTNMNKEAKGHWLRKDSKACQHKDLSSEELAIPRKSWQFL